MDRCPTEPDATPLALDWVSKRNCALAPRQLAWLLAIPAGSSMLIAASFARSGAWWVLVFATIEVGALVAAFLYYARHAGAYERLVLRPDCLILEYNSGANTTREELNPSLVRIECPCARIPGFDDEGLVIVSGSGRRLRLGRFVPAAQRPALASWLRQQIRLAARQVAARPGAHPAGPVSAGPRIASQ